MQRNNNVSLGNGDEILFDSDERRPSHSRKRAYRDAKRHQRKRTATTPACGFNARRQRRGGW